MGAKCDLNTSTCAVILSSEIQKSQQEKAGEAAI